VVELETTDASGLDMLDQDEARPTGSGQKEDWGSETEPQSKPRRTHEVM